MSGNNINGDPPAGDRLPPPAFPRGRRRWRVPAPPPDANPPFEEELRPPAEAPQSLNDDVEVLPDEWAVREETLQDEVVTSEAAPAVRTQPPMVPEGFEEDLADPVSEPAEAPGDVEGEFVPEAAEGWEAAEVELVTETIDAAPEPDAGSETDAASPLESAPVDPHVEVVAALVRRLADDLEAHGETALAADPEGSPFEATLRAYCVGYLEGLRELESSDPDTP